jgi:hypothetical protein
MECGPEGVRADPPKDESVTTGAVSSYTSSKEGVERALRDAISVLGCRKDVIHAPRFIVIEVYDNGQQWPDIPCLPHWCSGCAIESRIRSAWWPKDNISLFTARLHQRLPRGLYRHP